jgi:hypothetical protein
VTLAAVRSRDEAHLYLDLHSCDECGSVDTAWVSSLVASGEPGGSGEVIVRYAGTCGGCGADREFFFGLPEREVAPVGFPTFGGPEPSQLLDAGEWLWVAGLTADAASGEDPAEARWALAIAVAALEEVVKFIPPGQERVPEQAFWSEQGRRLRDAEPSRFTVDRLLDVRDAYRELSQRHGG